jgi:hypothetical protein
MKKKGKTKISSLTGVLILFFIFSTLSAIRNVADYSANIYFECKNVISNEVGEYGYREIFICGGERKRELLQRNVSLVFSILFLFLAVLSWKIDKLKKNNF